MCITTAPTVAQRWMVMGMYDCEKFVHEEMCDQPGRHLWGTLNGEKECSDFKDRTKYVEVVHGRWESWGIFDDLAKCSVCGAGSFTMHFVHYHNFKHCPNCGAQMDGERRDGE